MMHIRSKKHILNRITVVITLMLILMSFNSFYNEHMVFAIPTEADEDKIILIDPGQKAENDADADADADSKATSRNKNYADADAYAKNKNYADADAYAKNKADADADADAKAKNKNYVDADAINKTTPPKKPHY